jgi:large subunit ribosomal protein L6
LKFILGFSSPVQYDIPKGIDIKIDKQVNIVVSVLIKSWSAGLRRKSGL